MLVARVWPTAFNAPGWHDTPDGLMPHRMLWAWVGMLDVVDAHDRLVVAVGTRLASAADFAGAIENDQARMHPL